ncbi:hypothetical protein CASFOL_040104 [Castilleja foliolosa]|uniref:Uncharacterized protein n=1 Tax=Castilleja foliolosa TaxID=1961234 RepID=A0ABD3BEK2_9LAMI
MLAAQSSGGHHQPIQGPKTSRRPLQPKNQTSIITITNPTLKPNPVEWDNSNKENLFLPSIFTKDSSFPMDASLADELSAIREKLERLRIDRENNEKMLGEKGFLLDLRLKEIVDRGEIQKQLEMEVDRLYRLKEIRIACTRISQIRSLRDKEQEKKMNRDMLNKAHSTKDEDRDEQKGERSSHGISEVD